MRAIAILLVVWFHISQNNAEMASWALLPHGYYGVDVFIVIMGFLLIRGFVNKPDITWRHFAINKLTRLFAPLAVIIIITCMLAPLCMDATSLVSMAKTGFSGLLAEANFQLLRSTSGYFAEDASMNPFLHLWYHSVAVQLFVLAFIIFVFLKKKKIRTTLIVLILMGIISFIYSMLFPLGILIRILGLPCPWELTTVSYYDPLARVWELLAGGVVLLLPDIRSKKTAGIISLSALLMILIPASAKSISSLISSLASIAVVIGTVLLIRYTQQSHLSHLFTNKAAMWLGKISFSLYLVHVPVIVLYKGYFFNPLTLTPAIIILIISIIAAWMFYHFAEKRLFSLLHIAIIWLFGIILCLTYCLSDGMKSVWNVESNQINYKKYPQAEVCKYPGIHDYMDYQALNLHIGWWRNANWFQIPPSSKQGALPKERLFQLGDATCEPSFVMIGDSHAQHFFMGVDTICKENKLSGVFLGSIIEPLWDREGPVNGQDYYYNREKAFALFNWLKHHPEIKTVIIGQLWKKLNRRNLDWDLSPTPANLESNTDALREFCHRLKHLGKQVVFIAPVPILNSDKVLVSARWLKRRNLPESRIPKSLTCSTEQYNETYGEINNVLNQLCTENSYHILEPHRYLFEEGQCQAIRNNKILYIDNNHLSACGSIMLTRKIEKQLITLIKQPK